MHRLKFVGIILGLLCLSPLAQAVHPPIADFRSPIVADDTEPNLFVYPDAINLDNLINPQQPGGDFWSYLGDGTYTVNGREPIDLEDDDDDPFSPGAKQINAGAGDDPQSVDSNLRTLTFRNRALSPPGGPNVDPGEYGILDDQTRILTLVQSDGQQVAIRPFLIYTDTTGPDRLLDPAGVFPVSPVTTPSTQQGWHSGTLLGQPIFSEAGGLCIETPAEGSTFAYWTSPYGLLTLVPNSLYSIRIRVGRSVGMPSGATPLWDFMIDNFGSETGVNPLKYASDTIVWDTHGGANAAGAGVNGRTTFQFWWAPAAAKTEDWNDPVNGQFSAANDPNNDARFHFRLMDVEEAIDAQNDAGTLCLERYVIDRRGIDEFSVVETHYYEPALSGLTHHMTQLSAGSTELQFVNGHAVIRPTSVTAWETELITLETGDTIVDFEDSGTFRDNWPIRWNSDQLLRMTVGIKAPDLLSQNNPPDVLGFGFDTITSELGNISLISSAYNSLGFPKAGVVQKYVAYFYTHTSTSSPNLDFRRIRPRIFILNRPEIHGGSQPTNIGGITVTSQKVESIRQLN